MREAFERALQRAGWWNRAPGLWREPGADYYGALWTLDEAVVIQFASAPKSCTVQEAKVEEDHNGRF